METRSRGLRPWFTRATRTLACLLAGMILLSGCAAIETSSPPPGRAETPAPPAQTKIDAFQAERLKRIMVPLIKVMDHPRPLDQVKIGVLDDQLAILAHEIAHDDLGHVAKAQALGAGLGIGAIILDQIIPGSGQIAPIAGALISRTYSRKEEYEADHHGVILLKRVGQPKEVMINTLTWLMQTEGTGGGGFFATHPATGDRIEALRKL